MREDGKVTFLIIATLESPNRWTSVHFVRATSLTDAYSEVIKKDMFQHSAIRLEGYVLDIVMIPGIKEIAQAYWERGRKDDTADFEAFWEEHGVYPEMD